VNAPLAIVTGASRGIGRHVVERLRRRGHHVAALARSADELQALAAATGCEPLVVDVGDPVAVKSAVQGLLSRHAACDLLVNNAGYGLRAAVEELGLPEFRRELEVNLIAPVLLSQLVLPGMRSRRRGTIVHVGSVAGHVATPLSGAYAATKFGLRAIADAQRVEVAPFGVRVVLVEPGPVTTGFAETAAQGSAKLVSDPWSPYHLVYERLATHLRQLHAGNAWPADLVAERIVGAALSDDPPRVVAAYGWFLWASMALRTTAPGLFDHLVSRRMGFAQLPQEPPGDPGPRPPAAG
jgi:short-subunit dehydrogenase